MGWDGADWKYGRSRRGLSVVCAGCVECVSCVLCTYSSGVRAARRFKLIHHLPGNLQTAFAQKSAENESGTSEGGASWMLQRSVQSLVDGPSGTQAEKQERGA